LGDGREIDVGQNRGLRKLCACDRRVWAKCPHTWYFNFAWVGRHCRFSLDRHYGRHIDSKTEAEALAELIRVAIRAGTFGERPKLAPPPTPAEHSTDITFEQLGQRWLKHERVDKVQTAVDDRSRLRTLFVIPLAEGTPLGHRVANGVTEDDLELVFDVLRQRGYAASTINHYIQTLKSVERWAVRKGHLSRPWLTPGSSVRRK
jgi:hypothetical protein